MLRLNIWLRRRPKKGSVNSTKKSHSKEKSVRTPAIIEKPEEFISEDPGLSLKLAKTLGMCVITMSNC